MIRLDQDMDLGAAARATNRVADDPAHGIARRDRSRAYQLLAGLERDVGDLAWGGIDLIECAFGPDEPLHRVDEPVATWFDPRGIVGAADPIPRGGRNRQSGHPRGCPATGRRRLQLAGQRQRHGNRDDLR